MDTVDSILIKYLPPKSVPVIADWLRNSNVQLRINRARSTKLGDYRPPLRKKYHRISVNHDLNKYQFLITLVHEFAHLHVWNNFKGKVKPHGEEWKSEFRQLMKPFLTEETIPKELILVLSDYLVNPAASSSNISLSNALRNYDSGTDFLTLADLPDNSVFRINNGFVFQKITRLRKRYKCKRLDNNRMYLVSPLIEVIPVHD
jgi:hypothetical protein